MSWYYANDGTQLGPVSDEQFAQLVATGVIRAETLVWQEGMASWQSYAQLTSTHPALGQTALMAGAPPPSGAAPAPIAGTVACSECRQLVPQDSAISYGTLWVCARCKPVFLQRLREGAGNQTAEGLPYAGFWIRLAARFLDGLIMGVAVGIPTLLIFGFGLGGFSGRPSVSGQFALQAILQVASLAISVAYETFFIGRFGATPGKMAVGIKVITPEGGPVTYGRAFGRAWADRLSALVCYVGYLMAAFDAEKRTLHDHMCQTRVVYK
jgi:uncharacterized RDD family membrane protein YckC